jgi:hypothetical protein
MAKPSDGRDKRILGLEKQLGWALEQLNHLVSLREDGSAYIRGTGTEIAGFAHDYHQAEDVLHDKLKGGGRI